MSGDRLDLVEWLESEAKLIALPRLAEAAAELKRLRADRVTLSARVAMAVGEVARYRAVGLRPFDLEREHEVKRLRAELELARAEKKELRAEIDNLQSENRALAYQVKVRP